MQITRELQEYVKESIKVSYSNVIITDLEKIRLIQFIDECGQYQNKEYWLSHSIKEVLERWNYSIKPKGLFLLKNKEECIDVVTDDKIPYSCQIIFPIISNNHIEGLLILYRTYGNYIESSVRSVESFRDFVTKFINDANDEGRGLWKKNRIKKI